MISLYRLSPGGCGTAAEKWRTARYSYKCPGTAGKLRLLPVHLPGKTRMHPKHSYESAIRAVKGTDPREIVIGVGAAFQTEIRSTIVGVPLDEVLRNVKAGIEEEGMTSRV
ncbi:MAG: hypothetical protein V8Q57_04365 [Blautia sp.]